jgi:predicted nucleotidyltransferase
MTKQSVNLEDVRARLKQVFEHFPEVRAVFLFGSIAEGRAGPESDLDLAIIPTGPDLMARQLELLAALVRAGFDRVDLIFLDGRDIVLQFEAVRPNCLIYAREGFDRGAFYSRVVREYLDFLPYLAVQREALKRRLLHA